MNKLLLAIFILFLFCLLPGSIIHAQFEPMEQAPKEETLEATITDIPEEKKIELTDKKQLYQKLELLVTKGSLKDKKIIIESGNLPMANLPKYQIGDRVLVTKGQDFEGNDNYYITDYIRINSLFWLFFIFVVLTVVVARWKGFFSILGMGFTFLIIFMFILPKIASGSDPVVIAILGSLAIIPLSFYLSHGLNKKTTIAIIGSIIALVITGILATIFVEASHLTGFASEEAGFLQVAKQGAINMKGLLLAGIIIGALGILDDITVSQSAVVAQLKSTNPKLKPEEIYKRAMNIGQDHISSMVNTLVLVYSGAALPLLVIFIDNPHPFSEIINYEIIADEIVRTLVGSIGLILAVPVTTFIAVFIAKK